MLRACAQGVNNWEKANVWRVSRDSKQRFLFKTNITTKLIWSPSPEVSSAQQEGGGGGGLSISLNDASHPSGNMTQKWRQQLNDKCEPNAAWFSAVMTARMGTGRGLETSLSGADQHRLLLIVFLPLKYLYGSQWKAEKKHPNAVPLCPYFQNSKKKKKKISKGRRRIL